MPCGKTPEQTQEDKDEARYGPNLMINSFAEEGLVGWIAAGAVIVSGGFTDGVGGIGNYAFEVGTNGNLSQELLPAMPCDVQDYKITANFIPEYPEVDIDVEMVMQVDIAYIDGTLDTVDVPIEQAIVVGG